MEWNRRSGIRSPSASQPGYAYTGAGPLWCTFLQAREADLSSRKGVERVNLGWVQDAGTHGRKGSVVFHARELVGPSLQPFLTLRRRDRPSTNASVMAHLHQSGGHFF